MLVNKPNKRSAVRLHFSGGLGNQLFQYAFYNFLISSGVQVHPEFGCMPVRVDTSGRPWIESVGSFEKPMNKTNIVKTIVFRRFININSLISTIHKSTDFKLQNSNKSITRIPFGVIVNDLGGVPQIEKLISGNVFGYFQSSEWTKKDEILGRVILTDPGSELLILSENEKPLIVHVRLGDYAENPDLGILPKSYYLEAIHASLDNFHHGAIWLFSDDPSQALDFIPEKFKHLVRIMESPQDTPPETLNKMRYGYGYVLANSSLSWWSALLSFQDSPNVIVPSPWFRKLEEPRNLFLREWKITRVDWRD